MKTIELVTDLEGSYLAYAQEVINDRALPRVEDGLKPVQRRILYAMHQMGLRHNTPYKKSARIVGEVLGKWHPHGDSAVYDAQVRLVQDFTMQAPLIDGQGNFGTIDGDGAAAMRYTEARLTEIAEWMTRDIHRDTVDFTPNFDGSLQEPVILPAALPNLLVNGASGVAVALATNMPPHNLGEVCRALMYLATHWDDRDTLPTTTLMQHIPGPDFPTGGIVYRYRTEDGTEVDTIKQAYDTGRARLITQGQLTVIPTKGGKADIVITELPYAVKKTTVLERIAKEVRDGRITGVTDLRDESDYEGMRVIVEVARGADPNGVVEQLLNYTTLRQTFGVTNRALVADDDGAVVPQLLSLRDLLVHFVQHRLTVIERRSRHELAEREARQHLVAGLLRALDMIDAVIQTIRGSESLQAARQNLVTDLDFSDAQAQAIVAMPVGRLAALEQAKLREEQATLAERIGYLQALLADEAARLAVVIAETEQLQAAFAAP